jgi:hypothetical protein
MEQSTIHTTMAPNTDDDPNNAINSTNTLPFMKLVPELRNTIYEYALRLGNNGIFQVSETNPIPEPPLLLTCKDIRREALPLFYSLNSMFLIIDSYSPAMPLFIYKKQLAVLAQYDYQITVGSVMPSGPRRWHNLLAWLRHAHGQEYIGIPFTRLGSPLKPGAYVRWAGDPIREWVVVAGMFRMVDVMDDEDWEVVEETLSVMRYALVKFHAEWDVD